MMHLHNPLFKLAQHHHGDQKYGDSPYTAHLIGVADKVDTLYATDKNRRLLIDIAYLHDLFEDTDCTEETLRTELIGYKEMDRLVGALGAITKKPEEPRLDYIMRCAENPLALKVKVADTLSNLECSIRDADSRRVAKYTSQIHQLYAYLEVLLID